MTDRVEHILSKLSLHQKKTLLRMSSSDSGAAIADSLPENKDDAHATADAFLRPLVMSFVAEEDARNKRFPDGQLFGQLKSSIRDSQKGFRNPS